jgi:hypothetical protein
MSEIIKSEIISRRTALPLMGLAAVVRPRGKLERQPVFPGRYLDLQNKWIGLFTGQVGYAWNNVLWYVKGGAAVANQRWDLFNSVNGVGIVQAERTRWGGTVGTGFEYGFAPNWSVGIEYDYLFRVSDSNTFLTLGDRNASCYRHLVHRQRQIRCQYDHRAHQLPLQLGQPGRGEILISAVFDFCSKLGRQKCRPFC